MKKILTASLVFLSVVSFAQNKSTPAKKPVTKPAAHATQEKLLKTTLDSVSYSIGMSVANNMQQLGIKSLNANILAKALNDALAGKQLLLTEQDVNAVMMAYIEKLQSDKVKPMIAAGEKFLAGNKKRAGVKTTASGLQYEIIREGTGVKPGAADTFVAHYSGKLFTGEEFDNSYNRGTPLTLGVGQVIKGWTEGLQLMPVGSKYKFYIPYELGYGLHGQGQQIPGGAVLVFDVELLDVKKAQ